MTLDTKGSLYEPKTVPNPIKQKEKYLEAISQQFKMFKFNNRVKISKDQELKIEDYFENLGRYNSNYNYRVDQKILLERNFKTEKNEFLSKLIEEQKNEVGKDQKDKEGYLNLLENLQKKEFDKSEKTKGKTKGFEGDFENEANERKEKQKKESFRINNDIMKVTGSNKVLIFPSVIFFLLFSKR